MRGRVPAAPSQTFVHVVCCLPTLADAAAAATHLSLLLVNSNPASILRPRFLLLRHWHSCCRIRCCCLPAAASSSTPPEASFLVLLLLLMLLLLVRLLLSFPLLPLLLLLVPLLLVMLLLRCSCERFAASAYLRLQLLPLEAQNAALILLSASDYVYTETRLQQCGKRKEKGSRKKRSRTNRKSFCERRR